MEYYLDAFRKYAEFEGRARRKQYWMFALFNVIIFFVIALIEVALNTTLISSIYSLVVIVPSLSITARRLHDIGKSGWWQLIYFVPLIGIIVMLVFLCQDSEEENQYGISPKFA